MARPRTATNILDARGAFKKNPNRKRTGEPTVDRPFRKSAPRQLTDEQKICWKEIVKACPAGVLTAADHLIVEVVAVLLAEFRRSGAEMSAAHLNRMTTQMGRLGLDPSGRASLTVDRPKANEFDDV